MQTNMHGVFGCLPGDCTVKGRTIDAFLVVASTRWNDAPRNNPVVRVDHEAFEGKNSALELSVS